MDKMKNSMNEKMRLDRFLASVGVGTRSEVKTMIRKGQVTINGVVCKNADTKLESSLDEVAVNGKICQYVKYEYYMLNKAAGFVSATQDNLHKTVMDSIQSEKKDELFPVGRLDIDTEGLLLITNDGMLAHQLLSPSKHVAKTYYAQIEGVVTSEDAEQFQKGVEIGEKRPTLPAHLTILNSAQQSEIELTICEGKFHQVKRMFHAVGKEVLYLKRISFGSLKLDPDLALGSYRPLTEAELEELKKGVLHE